MANLTLRTLTRPGDTTKNAPLTNAEVDTNFINLDADLDSKAPLASPALTGTPTAPTAAAGTNTTQIATTAHVFAERSNTATLTNKTVNLGSNNLSGTIAQFNSALSDADFATLSGSETLTNKAITNSSIAATNFSSSDDTPEFTGVGALLVPRGTDAQRPTGVAGLFRYNTTTTKFEGYSGSAWGAIGGGATGSNGNTVFWENDQTVTANYTVTANKNAGTFGPVTVNNGVVVTVPNGSVWTIV